MHLRGATGIGPNRTPKASLAALQRTWWSRNWMIFCAAGSGSAGEQIPLHHVICRQLSMVVLAFYLSVRDVIPEHLHGN